MRKTYECDIERRLVARVRALGGLAYKFASPSRRGVPDRLCLLPGGIIVFVEVKAPGRKLTGLQLLERDKIAALGFDVVVVDSFEAVERLYEELERKTCLSARETPQESEAGAKGKAG